MRTERLANMDRGWFVGDFDPTCLRTSSCEAACKHYRAGESEGKHIHKIATEITLIVSGKVKMNDEEYCPGDIIIIEPGDSTDFVTIEDAITVVIKIPSVVGDKYLAKQSQPNS